MVNFKELLEAKPELWETAADDILAVAKQAERTAANIHSNGTAPLQSSWPDETGESARRALKVCAERMVDTGILARGGATALDTLEDAVRTAQNSLKAAVSYARSRGFSVSGDGKVTVPDTVDDEDRDLAKRAAVEAQSMIDDAVEAATQADQSCVDAINAVAVDPDAVTTDEARSRQSTAVREALESIRNLLPDGQPESEVRRWWANLTPEEKQMFKRAVPVELFDLKGIPDAVKRELDNPGRGYSPVGTVRWAKANAMSTEIDIFKNNCANFVSHSLHAGGMKYRQDALGGTLNSRNNSWGRAGAAEVGVPYVEGMTHSKSW